MEKIQPKLRFPEFKDEWNIYSLKSITTINPKPKPLPEEFIYIDLESVNKGVLLFEKIISKYEAPSRASRTIEKNDILFQTVRPYQRNNYLFTKNDSNYVASTGYAQLRTEQNPKFLYHILSTDNFNNDVMNKCTGTSYPAINSTDLGKVNINIPSLEEQTKIADFLGSVDKQIELLNTKKEKLTVYKKGVMQQLFSQQLRFKDDNGNDYPEWEEKTLGEVGEIVTGKTPSTSESKFWGGNYLFVTPTDLKENRKYLNQTSRTINDNFKIKKLPSNSIAYTCIASIGKMNLITEPFITNQQINSIISKEDNIEYLYYYLKFITPKIISKVSGNTMPIINKTDFSKVLIKLPVLEEQTKIANFLSAIDKQIETVETEINKTEVYKKGLLQQMFV